MSDRTGAFQAASRRFPVAEAAALCPDSTLRLCGIEQKDRRPG